MWCVLCKAPQGETNLSLVSLPPSPFLLFSVAFEFEGEFRLLKRSRLTWNKKHIFPLGGAAEAGFKNIVRNDPHNLPRLGGLRE